MPSSCAFPRAARPDTTVYEPRRPEQNGDLPRGRRPVHGPQPRVPAEARPRANSSPARPTQQHPLQNRVGNPIFLL